MKQKKIEYHYTEEQLKRYIIDVYEKYSNGEWVLHEQIDTEHSVYDVVDGKIGYWNSGRRSIFSELNMDFDSPTCGRCYKINRSYQSDNYRISDEKIMEFTYYGNYYYVLKQTSMRNGKISVCYAIRDEYDFIAWGTPVKYTEEEIMGYIREEYDKTQFKII